MAFHVVVFERSNYGYLPRCMFIGTLDIWLRGDTKVDDHIRTGRYCLIDDRAETERRVELISAW
jgi:hypothetical protein